jgi:ribosomal protein S2
MKIKKINKYQNKLLKLKIIQSKMYNKKQYLNNINIEDIEYRLKKAFHVIYKYNILNKKILFVGTPLRMNKTLQKVLQKTKHFLMPESVWRNGIITNKKKFFKNLQKNQKITTNNKVSKILSQLKKNIDLIVLLNEPLNNDALNESYLAKIPVISFNSNLSINNIKTSYKVPGDFQFSIKKTRDNFFYSILLSVLKKGNILKKGRTANSI